MFIFLKQEIPVCCIMLPGMIRKFLIKTNQCVPNPRPIKKAEEYVGFKASLATCTVSHKSIRLSKKYRCKFLLPKEWKHVFCLQRSPLQTLIPFHTCNFLSPTQSSPVSRTKVKIIQALCFLINFFQKPNFLSCKKALNKC